MSLNLMKEPGLTVAYLCLSPVCGTNATYDQKLTYDGRPVTISKQVTLKEFELFGGLVTNTVRHWIDVLNRCRYIRTTTTNIRRDGTHLDVLRPGDLITSLEDVALDISS
jgi:hypothetical protein